MFPHEDSSIFFTIDIDVFDLELYVLIYEKLLHFFPKDAILGSLSGNKGFHIDVFFKSFVNSQKINDFYDLLLDELNYPSHIELLGASDKGVKLPLGINFKNQVQDTQYCCLLDRHGTKLPDFHLLSIKQCSKNYLLDALEINNLTVKRTKTDVDTSKKDPLPVTKDSDFTYKRFYSIYVNGLIDYGTRHDCSLVLAIGFKTLGNTMDETYDLIIDWTAKQTFYKSSMREVKRDIKNMVKTVYARDYKLSLPEARFNKKNLMDVLSIKRYQLRPLYYRIYGHALKFANKSGYFYMTYEQMATKTSRKNLKTAVNLLSKLEKMTVIKSGVKNKPNHYQVPVNRVFDSHCFIACSRNCPNCFEYACKFLLTKEEIKGSFYSDEAEKILNMTYDCKHNILAD